MMTVAAIREMEEFRGANRECISREWKLEENRSYLAGSPVYSRRLDQQTLPSFATSSKSKSLEPVRHVQSVSTSKTTTVSSRPWFHNPELKRQKRVVKYKSYAVEGNRKTSLRNSFRWIKNKCATFVHGY